MARPTRETTPTDRFWANVTITDRCWEWTGHIGKKNRYGMLRVGGRSVKAHRFSYELHHGPIPLGVIVRHTCDNPRCVRPSHLTLGSQAQNVADAIERGRFTRAKRGANGRWTTAVSGEPTPAPDGGIGPETAVR